MNKKRKRVSGSHGVPRELEEEILLKFPVKISGPIQKCLQGLELSHNQPRHLHLQANKVPSSFLLGWARRDLFAVLLDNHGLGVDLDKKQVLSLLSVGGGDTIAVEELHLPIRPMLLGDGYGVIASLHGMHCDGIICLVDRSPLETFRIAFYNPALREKVFVHTPPSIPKFENVYCACGFGYDPRTNDYKYVRILRDKYSEAATKADVYSLRTCRWKEIKISTTMNVHGTAPCLKGRRQYMREEFLVWFDCMSDESFGRINLPRPRGTSTYMVPLLEWKGSLVYFHYSDSLEMWVMDGEAGGWSKYYWLGKFRGMSNPLALWKEDELLMEALDGSLMSISALRLSI